MAEEIVENADGEIQWNEDNDDIEVIVSDTPVEEEVVPEEFKGLSKTQIIEKLRAEETNRKEKVESDSVLSRLNDTLTNMNNKPALSPQPAPQLPEKPETIEQLREKYGEGMVTDPVGTIMKMNTEKLAPMVAQTLSGNLVLARKVLMLDPEKQTNFKKFAPQIDALVASAPMEARANPQIYEEAYKRVVADNIDSIIADKVGEAVKEALAKQAPTGPTRPATYVEGGRGQAPRPPAGPRKVVMPTKEADRLRLIGIDPEDFVRANQGGK
jgi:hypothetical protein